MESMLKLHTLTGRDFADYGLMRMAYVKPIRAAGSVFYAVHAANGTFLHQYADRDTAYAAVRQHDLEPATIH
jgi:hypothetical protein